MSLSSTSTEAEVWAEFDDNLCFRRTESREQCNAFIEACMALIRRRPTEIGRGNRSITMESIQQLYQDANNWLDLHPATSSSGSRTRYFSMENFRG